MAKGQKPFEVKLRGTEQTEKILLMAPINLREKVLKQALREASTVFQKQAQQNVRGLKAEGRDRWGKESSIPMERQIRRRLITRGNYVVGRTLTTGLARQYAASVEFGHRMFIYGRQKKGRRVTRHTFWRPAVDQTQRPINQLVLHSLRNSLRRITGK